MDEQPNNVLPAAPSEVSNTTRLEGGRAPQSVELEPVQESTVVVEVIEQDTADSEDISNVVQFVLPDLSIQQTITQLGISINYKIFSGWVRQPSPCCGAASVAGAWNALFGIHRSSLWAMEHKHMIAAYCSLFTTKIYSQLQSFERKLGAPIMDVLVQINAGLKVLGREFAGKKRCGPTKKTVFQSLVNFVKSVPKPLDSSQLESPTKCISPVECFRDLLVLDGVDLSTEVDIPDIPKHAEQEAGDEEKSEDSESEGENNDSKKAKPSAAWDWKKDLMGIIKNLSGLTKLMSSRPNTAPIGNWAVLQVVQRVSEWSDIGSALHARLFMGKYISKKQHLDVPLSKKDSADTIANQWGSLRTAFSRENTVLLFHLKNHYALIFALREWILPGEQSAIQGQTNSFVDGLRQSVSSASKAEPKVVRQILCARKGQRPTAWVDFDEARETMLGWEGYKIMAITLGSEILTAPLQTDSGYASHQERCKLEFCKQLEIDNECPHHTHVIWLMNYLGLLPSHY